MGPMGDGWVIAAAAAVVAGAWVPLPVPALVITAAGATALVAGSRVVLLVALVLVSSTLAHRSLAGLERDAPSDVDAVAVLVTDPERVDDAVRADLRIRGDRVESWSRDAEAGVLAGLLAGERVRITGRIRPVPDHRAGRLAVRHVGGVLDVTALEHVAGSTPFDRVANRLRRAYQRGAAVMGTARQTLFTGLVYGDDRGQPVGVAHDFRVAGLSHLLAVSGQNVAFVLAVAGPLLRRLGLLARTPLALALIAEFVVITRAEPSVMRAGLMAALAVVAAATGRPVPGLRLLASAVLALVLVDPMLARSVGFGLSVAASAGILLWSRRIALALPGPRWMVEPLAVTLAAQVAVAPVLVLVFGSVPIVAVPANLLAAPVAGPVMVWGLTGGLVAGLRPDLAPLLHTPTRWMVDWIAGVARAAAALPVPDLGPAEMAVSALAAGMILVTARTGGRTTTTLRTVAAALVALVAWVAFAPAPPPAPGQTVAGGAHIEIRCGATVLVVDGAWMPGVLDGLRRARIDSLHAVEVRGRADIAGIHDLVRRWGDPVVLRPDGPPSTPQWPCP